MEKTKNFESGLHSDFNTYLPFAPLLDVIGNCDRNPYSFETIVTVSSVNLAPSDDISAMNPPLGEATLRFVASAEAAISVTTKQHRMREQNKAVFIFQFD